LEIRSCRLDRRERSIEGRSLMRRGAAGSRLLPWKPVNPPSDDAAARMVPVFDRFLPMVEMTVGLLRCDPGQDAGTARHVAECDVARRHVARHPVRQTSNGPSVMWPGVVRPGAVRPGAMCPEGAGKGRRMRGA